MAAREIPHPGQLVVPQTPMAYEGLGIIRGPVNLVDAWQGQVSGLGVKDHQQDMLRGVVLRVFTPTAVKLVELAVALVTQHSGIGPGAGGGFFFLG
jgi:hypothetical protein